MPLVSAEDYSGGRSAKGAVAGVRVDRQKGGSVMANRESVIDKIRALLAKTVENGATEAEMMAALDKAAAMRDAYDISDEELQLPKEEKVALHADPADATDPHKLKWRLSY